MNSLKVAWLQGKWFGNIADTQAWYQEHARNYRGTGLDVLVLPELFHTPYFAFTEHASQFDHAIAKDDALVDEWRCIAQELNCVLVFPFFEKRSTGIYHNSVYVFERDGSIAGFYRKSHIPDDPGFYEKYYFVPGDTGFKVFATSAGNIGVLICWDQWFPEAARLLALQGADLVIYPTAIGWDSTEPQDVYARQRDSWQTVMRGHAIANRMFVLAVNRVGTENDLTFWGHSFVCAPDGYLLHETGPDFLGATTVTLDLSEIENQRRVWPHFRDRRVDLYVDILKMWGTP